MWIIPVFWSIKVMHFDLMKKRGVNGSMQIRRSEVILGPIRRSDLIFVKIRIRVTKNFSWYMESSVVAWKNELLNIVFL